MSLTPREIKRLRRLWEAADKSDGGEWTATKDGDVVYNLKKFREYGGLLVLMTGSNFQTPKPAVAAFCAAAKNAMPKLLDAIEWKKPKRKRLHSQKRR